MARLGISKGVLGFRRSSHDFSNVNVCCVQAKQWSLEHDEYRDGGYDEVC